MSENESVNESYNGWTNYETWNVVLWSMNDPDIYDAIRERGFYTSASAEEFFRTIYPEGTPDMGGAHDLDAVDWDEVARDWNEEQA